MRTKNLNAGAPLRGSEDPRAMKLFVNSVEKAFQVLECFDSEYRRLSLTQLSQRTGLDHSALQRFLHTLVTLGYLRRDERTRQYGLSTKILNLGTNYLRTNDLVERATPYLQAAHVEHGETINLIELDGTDTVFVGRFLARHPINIWILLGSRTPIYCSAAGRVILAHLPEGQAISILDRSDKRQLTQHTLTTTRAIMARVRQARTDGYAVSNEEFMLGDVSIGAPVFDAAGKVVAAVSVALSSDRWKRATVRQKLIGLAKDTARLISSNHGRR